jgi:hypothetical protein
MVLGTYIDIYGPNRQGEFVATLPSAQTRLITHWEDLEEIQATTGIKDVNGDVLNLMRRSRDPQRQVLPSTVSAAPVLI